MSVRKLYDELGWVKLSDRRRTHTLLLFYKLDHKLAPEYLCGLLPPHICDTSSYPLRNADNYAQVHALYGSSFLPSTVREWNKPPIEQRNAESLNTFKRKLTEDTPTIPNYYFYGNRIDQSCTRFLTECSSLNYHLYCRNLVPSPDCVCGEVENNNHHLLRCPRYAAIRNKIVNLFLRHSNVTVDILLYGNINLPVNNNEEIFTAVQKYILAKQNGLYHNSNRSKLSRS